MRPPLRQLAAYRLLGRRPDHRHDDWLRADLDSRAYPWRGASWSAPIGLALYLALAPLVWPGHLWVAPFVVVWGAGTEALVGARRRQATRDRFFPDEIPPDLGHFQPYRTTQPGAPGQGDS